MDLKSRLLKLRRDAGLTQLKVARALGITPQAVSQWERGEAIPEFDKLRRIAELYGVSVIIFFDENPEIYQDIDHIPSEQVLPHVSALSRTVPLKGYVGAGSEMHYYKVAHEDFEDVEMMPGATDQTVAVEIRGASFGPLLESWLVFYDDVRSPVTADLIGKTCVVGLADDRILIKKIVRNGRGRYTLLSNSHEPPIENAEIEWAAKVTAMRPRMR